MRDRESSHFLARLLTHERSLLVLIVTYFILCMGLLVYLRHEAVQAPAYATYFEELYVRLSLGGLAVLMTGALVGAHLLREKERAARGGLAPPLRTRFSPLQLRQDRIRLAWIIGLSLAIFAVDLYVTLGPSIGIAYVTVVLIAQFAHSPAQVWFAAVLGTILTSFKVVVSARVPELMWAALASRTLSVYAVWTVAVLGQWQRRTSRKQYRAELQAQETQSANIELQRALERAEAAESQARRGQQLLNTVAKMARIGGWEYDVATMTPSMSDAVFRIFEIVPGTQPSLDTALSFFPPESRVLVEQAFTAAVAHGTPYDLTVRFLNARGQHRWVRVIGMAEQIDGVTVRVTGALQDVTERHEGQARLDRAVRGTQDGFWEQDVDSRRSWLSPRFRELVGYNAVDLPDGIDVFAKLLHPDDRERFEQCRAQHPEQRSSPSTSRCACACATGNIAGSARARPRPTRSCTGQSHTSPAPFATSRRSGKPPGPAGRDRRGRRCQPREERLPRQHESRDPHADEWRARHDGADARHRSRSDAAPVRRDDPGQRHLAPHDPQRHPGFLEDRSRQAHDREEPRSTYASVSKTRAGCSRCRPPRKACASR